MPYLTPDSIPTTALCRRLRIPDEPLIIAAVNGAISELTKAYNWQSFGTVTPDDIANAMLAIYLEYEQTAINCMIGAIVAWTSQTIPSNCLLCDGSQYARTDYPDLYAVLDSAFIVDADNFVVPDLSDRVIRHPNNIANINANGGQDSVTLTGNELPAHSHTEVTATPVAITIGAGVPAPSAIPGIGITGNAGLGLPFDIKPQFLNLPYVVIAR